MRDPVGVAVLVDVDVVELDAPQLLGEHVGVFALAAGAVDDDRLRLLPLVAALCEELVDLVVDVRLPDGVGPRAGDVSLLVDRRAPGVEEEGAGCVERGDVVVLDLDVGLVGVGDETGDVRLRGYGGGGGRTAGHGSGHGRGRGMGGGGFGRSGGGC